MNYRDLVKFLSCGIGLGALKVEAVTFSKRRSFFNDISEAKWLSHVDSVTVFHDEWSLFVHIFDKPYPDQKVSYSDWSQRIGPLDLRRRTVSPDRIKGTKIMNKKFRKIGFNSGLPI